MAIHHVKAKKIDVFSITTVHFVRFFCVSLEEDIQCRYRIKYKYT